MSAISDELFSTLRSFTLQQTSRLFDPIQGPSSEFLSSDAVGEKRRVWNPGRGARLAVPRAIFLPFPPI